MSSKDRSEKAAQAMYEQLCAALTEEGWKFNKSDALHAVYCNIENEGKLYKMVFRIRAEQQIVCLHVLLPIKLPKKMRIDGAIAVNAVNFDLVNGNFDYNIKSGELFYRVSTFYRGSTLGGALFGYMLRLATTIAGVYQEKFEALAKGKIDIKTFVAEEMQ